MIDTAIITPGSDFSDTVLGAITWSKGIGRPKTHRLADGFAILIIGTDVVRTAPGGPVFHPAIVMVPEVSDGDGGTDNYRVEFSQRGLKSVEALTNAAFNLDATAKAEIELMSTYKITLSFRPGVAWASSPPPAITPVRVDPRELVFQKHEGTLQLPDFGITDSRF